MLAVSMQDNSHQFVCFNQCFAISMAGKYFQV